MTVPTLTTRRPTGLPPHPMLLVAGVEKAGKSYGAALFSASDLIDRTFYIEVGEGAADQYGAIPGVRYEIVDHDGTFKGIANAAWAATQQPRGDRPHAIVIDNVTEVWDLLTEEAQAKANRRAAAKAAERKKPAPAEDVQITMDLWNEAKKKWRRFLEVLRVYDGPVVLLARLELVAVMDGNAPAKDGSREWKIRAEKNLPYEVDAIVKMTAPQQAALTGVRSTLVQVPPGSELPLPQFTIDGLLRRMGLGEPGATAPRSYTAPRAVLDDSAPERPAQRQQPSGPQTDQWSTPPAAPAPAAPTAPTGSPAMASKGQLANLKISFDENGITSRDERLRLISELLGRPISTSAELNVEEYRHVVSRLRAGWPHIDPTIGARPVDAAPSAPEPPAVGTPDNPAILPAQERMITGLMKQGGHTPAGVLALAKQVTGRDISTSRELSKTEAEALILALTTGHLPAAAAAADTGEGIGVMDALHQLINDARGDDDFEQARADIEREHAEGTIGGDDLAALLARLADVRTEARQMAGVAA